MRILFFLTLILFALITPPKIFAACGSCDYVSTLGSAVSCPGTPTCCNYAYECVPATGQDPGKPSSFFSTFITAINLSPNVTSLSGIINTLVPYIFIFAGIILFGMLIMGGFQFLTAGADPKQADQGQQRITSAIIGFLIIIVAYWLTQIAEIILGIKILGV